MPAMNWQLTNEMPACAWLTSTRTEFGPMSEPLLGLEKITPTDEIGGHGVSKPVEADALETRFVPNLREPVAEPARGEASTVVEVPGEQPVAELALAGHSPAPCRLVGPPQIDCRTSQRQPAHLPGLRRADHFY